MATATSKETASQNFPLHRAVFANDVAALEAAIRAAHGEDAINQHDLHGNTPISLAIMLGRKGEHQIGFLACHDVLTKRSDMSHHLQTALTSSSTVAATS